MSKRNIKINFENVNFTFEGLSVDEYRLQKISKQILAILDEKIKKEFPANTITDNVFLEDLSVPKIKISDDMTDEDIVNIVAARITQRLKDSPP